MQVTGDHIYIPDSDLGSTLDANASCFIQRCVSSEHVYTNDRGWRVPAPDIVAVPRDAAMIGCSWPMGVGVECEDSFAHRFSENADVSLANLGVGSYSFLQSVRRLEQEIAFIRPKTVVLAYGSWLVDRCFKSNAMGNVIFRPIYRQSPSQDLILCEPPKALPALIHSYVELCRHDASSLSLAARFKKSLLYHRITLHNRRYGASLLSNSSYITHADGDGYFAYRQRVLGDLAKRLSDVCEQHGAKLLVFHLHQYIPRSAEDQRGIEEDTAFWTAFSGERSSIHYEPPETMEARFNEVIAGLDEPEAFLDVLHLSDNNHPSAEGHKLISEVLTQSYQKIR